MEEVLEALLPAEVTKQTSFETVGQIAHLNLRSDCLPYKDIIGQVILDVSRLKFRKDIQGKARK